MVSILDATLREGEQTPGVYFDSHIKVAIARLLDEIGVDIIEAGHPLVSTRIYDALKKISSLNLKATIGAHSRSLQKDVDVALECNVSFLGVFFCVSEDRLDGVFEKTLTEAIDQITQVIKYAKAKNQNLTIRFTPEDTVRSKAENVVQASVEAVKAGADIISIADTTGYMIPGTDRNMYDFVRNLKAELNAFGVNPKTAVHCHNDRGLALANALDAYKAGVDIIDATVMGLGERAGIVDLAQLMVTLKEDFNVQKNWKIHKLKDLYQLVSEHSRIGIQENFPIMGKNAFTHCAGVHTQAAIINPLHYQSIDPEIVGRKMNISLDHMSGIASLRYALEQIGETELTQETIAEILSKVRQVGHKGRIVNLEELQYIVNSVK